MVTFRRLLAVLALLLPVAAFAQSGLTLGPSGGGGSGGGGTGCVPSGGSSTNIVLYGAAGACNPALDANITNGALTLGLANTTIGSLILEGSSSGAATITGGTNGTLTSASPVALSGLVTLTGASNALGTPLTLVLTNATGLPLTTGVTGILPVPNGGTGASTLTASGLVLAHGTSAFTALAEVDGDCVVGAAGAWTAASCPGGGSGLTVNSTLISGGAANKVLIDDGTKLQELTYALTGNSVIVETTSGGLLTASILPLGTNTTAGAVKGDGQSVCVTAGVAAACAPNRSTSTSPIVVATTDYNGQINWTGSSAGTVSNFSAPGTGISVALCNQSSAALTLPTVPTINGYTATTLPAVSGGTAACINLISNGTSMDAQASVPSTGAVSSVANSDGTLTVSPTTGAAVASLNLSHANVWSAQQSATITSLTISTATFTPTGASNDYAITLVHASCPCTLANPSGTPVAGTHGIITVTQSSTGSDTIGTYGSEYEAPGGTGSITLSTGANALDTLSYLVKDSTHILLFPALNFSH